MAVTRHRETRLRCESLGRCDSSAEVSVHSPRGHASIREAHDTIVRKPTAKPTTRPPRTTNTQHRGQISVFSGSDLDFFKMRGSRSDPTRLTPSEGARRRAGGDELALHLRWEVRRRESPKAPRRLRQKSSRSVLSTSSSAMASCRFANSGNDMATRAMRTNIAVVPSFPVWPELSRQTVTMCRTDTSTGVLFNARNTVT